MFLKYIKSIHCNRKLLWEMSKRDFKSRFLGSFLGVIWGFISPLVTILLYWFVFEFGLRTGERADQIPYVLWMVTGIIPWLFICETIPNSSSSLIEYSYIVKKVMFELKLIPLIKVISSSFVHFFFIVINIILLCAYGYGITAYWWQLIILIPYCYLVILAFSYLNAALVPFFRDLPQLISIVLQLGFWATPIIWDATMIPSNLSILFRLNPVFYIVEGYRSIFLYKQSLFTNNAGFLLMILAMLILFAVALNIYDHLEGSFADSL